MRERRNRDAGFNARIALEALKGERTVLELAAEYGVHPTMIHQWSEPWSAIGPRTMASALIDGADIFERGGKKPVAKVE
ncbi:transposase [Paracoccus sp. 08]|uniref:transposase n=1 Tax=Paracoccus sp. 08 TaxID=2606624 RepID=UPI003532373B